MTTITACLNTIRRRLLTRGLARRSIARLFEPLAPSALRRARQLGRDAAALGFDWERATEALDKVREEVGELAELLEPLESGQARGEAARHEAARHEAAGHEAAIAEELGDLLFAVVNVARKLEVDAEGALHAANRKFERRFSYVLRGLADRGVRPEAAGLEMMEALWQEAKRAE